MASAAEPSGAPVRHMRVMNKRPFAVVFSIAVSVLLLLFGVAGPSVAGTPGWSVSKTPLSGSILSQFSGVSCPATSTCFAVGDQQDKGAGPIQSLVERWDGTHWSIVSSANAPGANYTNLSGITCLSKTSCVAVGAWEGLTSHALIERWNGRRWSVTPGPSLNPNEESWLFGVSCPGPSTCFAVGTVGDGTLIEHWDGTHWSATTDTPKAGQHEDLNDVSCPSPTSCVAVGNIFQGQPFVQRVLVEHWNGKRWTNMTGTQNP